MYVCKYVYMYVKISTAHSLWLVYVFVFIFARSQESKCVNVCMFDCIYFQRDLRKLGKTKRKYEHTHAKGVM